MLKAFGVDSGVGFIFVPILASSATRLAAQLWTGALRGKSLGVYLRCIYGIFSRSDQHHLAMRTSALPPVMDKETVSAAAYDRL